MMKFYMAPGSCTTGIHILLTELDLLFEVHMVNLPKGEHEQESYRRINPKSTIPTLILEDGQVLSDYLAISYWLAQAYPKAKLMADEPYTQARTLEHLNYIVGHLHGQGFARIFAGEKFSLGEDDLDLVNTQGRAIVEQALRLISDWLGNKKYLMGDFSIADTALFYTEFWADKLKIELPDNCMRHYDSMLSRPSVRQVLMEEGYRL